MGLIPARAGKTAGCPCQVTPRGAHPRAGGENQLSETCIIVGMGSSPRGRGKRVVGVWFPRRVGLIPARAGKTPKGPRP